MLDISKILTQAEIATALLIIAISLLILVHKKNARVNK